MIEVVTASCYIRIGDTDSTCLDYSLLLVISTVAHHLRVYRIHIRWNLPQNPEKIPPNQLILTPTLVVRNIQSESQCSPRPLVDDGIPSSNAGSVPPNNDPLSHLEFIPTAPETRNSESTFPTILAIFSRVSSALESPHLYQESSSVVARWELRSMPRNLHPSFDQLISKKTVDNTRSNNPVCFPLYSVLSNRNERLIRIAFRCASQTRRCDIE